MKTKSKHNRLAAVFLALAMLLTSISFGMFASAEETASGTGSYVLSGDAFEAKTYESGAVSEKVGTDGYFTINWGSKGKVVNKPKDFSDNYSGKNYISFEGKSDLKSRYIQFTTTGMAQVKVWWLSSGDNRPIEIYDSKQEKVTSTSVSVKDATYVNTLKIEVPTADTYYLTSKVEKAFIYKVEVTPVAPEVAYDLVGDDFKAESYESGAITENVGTNGLFTINWGSKGKVVNKPKEFSDKTKMDNYISFEGKSDLKSRYIQFTTNSAARVKIWWLSSGDNRPVEIYDAKTQEKITSTSVSVKDTTYVNTLKVPTAGTYLLTSKVEKAFIYKISVIEGGFDYVERCAWADVDDPVISNVEQEDGDIKVTVDAVIDPADGGDQVDVLIYDSEGNEMGKASSVSENKTHTLKFSPKATGEYSLKAFLSRVADDNGKYDVKVSDMVDFAYTLPLAAPVISSATSKGGTGNNGTMELIWTSVDEATGYAVYSDGNEVAKVDGIDKTTYVVPGLTVGENHTFAVAAVRGSETGPKSAEVTARATEDERRTWGYTIYGTSTNATDGSNGYTGGVNTDEGTVTVFSENGKGKLESGAVDGIMFYYTAVPSDKNFVLRANMHVDKWTFSNGQEAMGLLASDSIPEVMSTKPYWTNNYYLTLGTVAYNWSNGEVVYDGTGTKYDMRFGLGVYPNLGVTKENQANIAELGLAGVVDPNIQYPLDLTAAQQGLLTGRYNIAANMTNATAAGVPETVANDGKGITDFDVEIRKNNTGYFFTYYDQNGRVIRTQKFYDTEALSHVDEDNVYVGFFAARNARATFSDINLTLINPEDDAPAEERPITYVTPRLTITSAGVANSSDYELTMLSNVDGYATIYLDGEVVSTNEFVRADELFSTNIGISEGSNKISVTFIPDPNQDLGEYTELDPMIDELEATIRVAYNTNYANQNNLYVSPNGSNIGNGSSDYPLDIFTAISVAKPGQTIVIMEGIYSFYSTIRIERGMNGTADAPIRMIADPEAATRPVFDFNGYCEGFRLGGNYWYVSGFDVTNSGNGTTGFRVCGNNNTLDQINAYNNGNTGIQISAFRDSTDPRELWPSNNLILNCTSHNNADAGYEDADGFAAKITCGDGNVFDGCISYNNADDGWDLFARASSGNIGSVTIRNCVAYNNGILEDGTNAGNGNGFKLGGGNLAGGHKLINSVAFNNKADGITSNSCPDVQVINCTSYGNGKSNLNLYTGGNVSTNFVVEGFISCNGGAADIIKPNGTDTSTVDEVSKTTVTADAFENTEFKGITRNEDGTISFADGFLKLTDKAPTGAGSDITGDNATSTPSEDTGEITPDENLPKPPSSSGSSSTPSTPSDPSTPSEPSTPATPDSGVIEFEHSGTDIEVTAPSNAFDNADEIKFNADPVAEETNDNQFTFDLNFTDKDGNKVQPKVAVTVKIPVPAALKDKTIYVYHVESDGKYTEISCKVENGMVVFTASSFSKYIITSEKLSAADPGSSTPSGEDTNPSTGAAVPVAGMAALMAGAAVTIFVTKRKRG